MAYFPISRSRHRATRLFASDTVARIASAGLTVLIGIAVLHWLPVRDARVSGRSAVAIEVVFLTPAPLPSASPAPLDAPAIADVRAPTPRRAAAPSRTAPDPATDATRTAPDAATRLDYGALLADTAPIAFAERLPGQRDAWRTPFEARPERFRMRRQITPEDVVRGFAQLVGLWPPGYTDSPCPAIRGLIATTPDVPSPRERALLQDAVLAREQFCS